jgi:hypothetical protein
MAVDGKIAKVPVQGMDWAGGSGVSKDAIAWSTWSWELRGGGGILMGGLTGRTIAVEALGVALLQSTLPNGKLSL